ncbi:MAG: phage tail tube protein [Pseudomonadota bacterium]
MTTAVETGHGSEFWLKVSAGTLTKLGEVFNIPVPNTEAAELIDASHMDSEVYKDYIQARLREGVESDIEMNWIPGSATDTLCKSAVGLTCEYKVVIPDGVDTVEFTGSCLVRNYMRNNPMDDKRTGTLTVKWTSDPVEAAGA